MTKIKIKETKNILILTYWSYHDALIQTYTLPYVRIIKKYLPANSKIFLVTLEQKQHNLSSCQVETPGTTKKIKETLKKENIYWINFKYYKFGFKAALHWIFYFLKLLLLVAGKEIKYIHAWCTPAGAIGYFLSLLTNWPLIIDSYEPHAEAMVENGNWRYDSLAYKLLFKLEKLQTKRAQYFISTTKGMQSYAYEKYGIKIGKFPLSTHLPPLSTPVERGLGLPHSEERAYRGGEVNFYVKPACVDLNLFSQKNLKKEALVKKYGYNNKIVCVYAGKFGGIYLEQEVFDFFKIAHDYWGEKFRVLLLTSHKKEEIESYAEKSKFDIDLINIKFVRHNEIPDYLGLADFAINPVKPIPTKRFCTSIKDGEYWALGLPVVITKNISDDSKIIQDNKIGTVLADLNNDAYLKAVTEIDEILKAYSRKDLFYKIRSVAIKYRSFNIAEKIYQEIYGELEN